MSKHTPGEWTYNEALGFIETQDDILVLMFEANAADARLIAAAPDLLEALSGLVDACEAHNSANGREMVDRHALERARAAITKAEATE
jgi:hypothetical protein